jgi:hypothetical protein
METNYQAEQTEKPIEENAGQADRSARDDEGLAQAQEATVGDDGSETRGLTGGGNEVTDMAEPPRPHRISKYRWGAVAGAGVAAATVLLSGCGEQPSAAPQQTASSSAPAKPRPFTGKYDNLCDPAIAPKLASASAKLDGLDPATANFHCKSQVQGAKGKFFDFTSGRTLSHGEQQGVIVAFFNKNSLNAIGRRVSGDVQAIEANGTHLKAAGLDGAYGVRPNSSASGGGNFGAFVFKTPDGEHTAIIESDSLSSFGKADPNMEQKLEAAVPDVKHLVSLAAKNYNLSEPSRTVNQETSGSAKDNVSGSFKNLCNAAIKNTLLREAARADGQPANSFDTCEPPTTTLKQGHEVMFEFYNQAAKQEAIKSGKLFDDSGNVINHISGIAIGDNTHPGNPSVVKLAKQEHPDYDKTFRAGSLSCIAYLDKQGGTGEKIICDTKDNNQQVVYDSDGANGYAPNPDGSLGFDNEKAHESWQHNQAAIQKMLGTVSRNFAFPGGAEVSGSAEPPQTSAAN